MASTRLLLEFEDAADDAERAPIQVRYFDAESVRGAEVGKPVAKTTASHTCQYAAADMTRLLTSGTRLNGRRLLVTISLYLFIPIIRAHWCSGFACP